MSALSQRAYPSALATSRLRFDALVEQSLPEAYRRLIEHIEAGNYVPDAPSWLRNMAAAIAQKQLQCSPLGVDPDGHGDLPATAPGPPTAQEKAEIAA
jgi:hypothetical protein